MVFAFPLRGALVSLDKATIVKNIRATDAATPPGKRQLIFLENHDIDRYMSEVHDDPAKARAGAAIALMLKGDPLIYYGQELGMRGVQPKNLGKSGGIPLTDAVGIPVREAFRWDANLEAPGSAIWYRGDQWFWKDRFNRSHDGVSLQEERAKPDSLYHWYKKLLALRHARPEISAGSQRILCDDDSAVLCILREDGAQRTLLLVNLGKTAARPKLGAPDSSTARIGSTCSTTASPAPRVPRCNRCRCGYWVLLRRTDTDSLSIAWNASSAPFAAVLLAIPTNTHCCQGYFANALLPSPPGRGVGGEGSGWPLRLAPPEPSPGCRHPLPGGEGLTHQRLCEFKSLGFDVQSESLGAWSLQTGTLGIPKCSAQSRK